MPIDRRDSLRFRVPIKYAVIAFNGPITIIGSIIGKYSRDTFTPGSQLPRLTPPAPAFRFRSPAPKPRALFPRRGGGEEGSIRNVNHRRGSICMFHAAAGSGIPTPRWTLISTIRRKRARARSFLFLKYETCNLASSIGDLHRRDRRAFEFSLMKFAARAEIARRVSATRFARGRANSWRRLDRGRQDANLAL